MNFISFVLLCGFGRPWWSVVCRVSTHSLQQQPSRVHFSKEYCNSVLTNCKCIIVQCTIGCITVHLMHCDRVNHIMTQSVNPLSASRSCCDPYASTPILTHLTRTKKCFLELIVSEFFFILDIIASPSIYPSQ